MGKNLEKLEELFKRTYFGSKEEYDNINNYYNSIKQALQRLESIDIANPNEALKSLGTLSSSNFYDSNREEYVEDTQEFKTIEQELSKAQMQEKVLSEIATVMDTWATSGLISDEIALNQISDIIKEVVSK